MNRNNYESKMQESVSERVSSPSWDLRIAGAVISRRRMRARRLVLSSTASLFVAALVVVLFLFGFRAQSGEIYEPFIAQQLAGTNAAVFPASDEGIGTGAKSGEIVFDSGVDSVIDNTLALR